jgi:copper chaperone CopZ
MLRVLRGVRVVDFVPTESRLTVEFDREETGLAEIVRIIEDAGPAVSSVAQREAA